MKNADRQLDAVAKRNDQYHSQEMDYVNSLAPACVSLGISWR